MPERPLGYLHRGLQHSLGVLPRVRIAGAQLRSVLCPPRIVVVSVVGAPIQDGDRTYVLVVVGELPVASLETAEVLDRARGGINRPAVSGLSVPSSGSGAVQLGNTVLGAGVCPVMR